MAVPSRVIAIEGGFATVEAFGVTRTCNLMLLSDPVGIGDYLILGAGGGFAAAKVAAADALVALEYLEEVLADGRA